MMSFNAFCGNSSFWDNKFSWNTTSPELSNCFESTVLIWVPCTVFWLWATYEMSMAYRSRKRPNKWAWLHITKQILNMSVFLLSAIKLISSLVIYTNEDKRDIELSNLIGDGIVTLTYIMVLFLTAYSKQKGILVSNALPAFWLLQCVSYAAITYSNYRRNLSDTKLERLNNVIDLIAVVIAPIQLIFNSFCETPSSFEILNNEEDIQENCPAKRNSLFAFISFSWATKTIISGTKRQLEIEHIDPLCKDMRSAVVTRVYDAAFQASARAIRDRDNLDPEVAIRRPVKLALVRSLWRVSRWTFSLGACFEFVFVMLTFVPPFLLSKLINFVETPSEVTWHGFVYAAAFWFVIFSQSITNSLSMYFCMVASIQVKNALISAVYRKIMLISNKAKKQYTAGEIVNLMAIDTQEIFEFTRYLYEFVGIPVRTSLTLWYLYSYLGPSAFASFGVFVILSPLSYLLGLKVDYYQDKVMKLKDKRLKQMSEILNGIKVLKLYAWERPFINKVLETRNSELGYLQKGAYLESFFAFLWIVAPYLICITCFATFLLSNSANVLTAEIAFVSFSLISMLRYPMGVLPDLLTRLVKSLVSLRRLKDFLFSEELNSATVGDNTNTGDSINIKNASFAWDESKLVLKNINLNVKKGSLVAIVGPVGSGKTSILSAILGEIPKKSGVINKNGSVAYVPQQAWIQNATLQKNIIFKKAYSQRRYTEVLDNCALKADLELLSGGDQTEIGEKGINLSGGQKQRVSLARAVYQNEDIYLLDDPLSAVDANVAAQLFKGVIGPTGMLKRKTRILATHNIAFLSETDHIVVLSDGEIAEQGSYETLMNDRGKFSEFLKEHTNQETKEEGENSIKSLDGSAASLMERQASVLSHDSSPTDHNPTIVDRLTEEESMQLGKVKWEVYYSYIKHLGVVLFIFIFIFNILSASLETGSGLWLSHWATNTDGLSSQTAGLGVYGGFIMTLALVIFACYILLFYGAVTAARNLHVELLDCIMRCPLSFFDTTPSGRILNRFSKDIETVDAQLPWSMGNMLNTVCWLPMTCIIISLSSLYLLPFMLVTFIIYMIILRFYLLTSNQLRRFDSVTRSPVYSNFTETIQGTSSIRAYNAQQYFINRSHQKVDDNIKCYYSNQIVSRWLDVVLAILASIIVLATALIAILNRDTLHVGVLGLALTYCIELSDGMGWLVKVGSQLESQVVGVERIREYSELPPEAEWEISETKPPISWPNQGAVEISNYTASYREGLDPVLVGIDLNITPGSKVGIVGRTGAGKSTFILSLFRIIEPTVGYIKIDGLNIHKLGTFDLRSKLTIIPQDPVLFEGTLRLNLDPWNEHSDDEIWTSLERSHLKDFVSGLEDGLEHTVNEGGENLSGGQRQLVCLARALLRKTKILVLDEATASVDLNTDNLIQVTVREDFADCTVITIAHRLNTIINSDKIICFANGKIVEEGKPEELLEDVESHFYSMAKDAGLV